MLSGLDPHSQFMEPDSFKDMQDDTRSRYDGLGLIVSAKDGVLIVVSTMEDTPAAKAGLLSGDQILKINGATTEKMQLSDAITALKGKPGDSITMQILRPSSKEVRDFTMMRAEIKVDSVKDTHLIDASLTGPYKVGYVRIIQFNEPTAEDLSKRLDDLQKQGMEALVLDLRNNPGGLLNSAVDVCGQFVPPNTMVVYTEGRTPSSRREYRTSTASKPRGDFPRGGPGQRRQRQRRGDRRRGAQGSQPRDPGRGNHLRQGQRAERDLAAGRLGGAADDGEVFHAQQAGDPPARRHADDPRDADERTGAGPNGQAREHRPERG